MTNADAEIRKMALTVLDDEYGIRADAYILLKPILFETGNQDIIDQVDVTEDRAYIGEDFAQEELKKME